MSFEIQTDIDSAKSNTPFLSDSKMCNSSTKCAKSAHSFVSRIPQEAVFLQMEDLNNLKNSVSNALIKAMPKCDVITIKIFELLISAINPKNPPKDFMIYIQKTALYQFLDLNSSTRGRDLERKLISFRNELYFNFSILNQNEREQVNKAIEKENERIGDNNLKLLPIHKNHIVSAVNEVFWETKESYVGFQLTPRIMFFLSNLGEDKPYTTYELIGISKFESKYSVIIYRWLKMKYQTFKYSVKEYSVKHKIEISMSDLRELTDTTDIYPRFASFEERVLKTAQKEINEYSVIKFDYKKNKKGRTIVSIQFFVADNIKNIPVKEEHLTPRKTKEEREQERFKNAYLANESKYTPMLRNRMFLSTNDIYNINLMSRLYEDVYSLYDKLVDEKGMQFLKIHLDIVSDRKANAESEISDLAAYLKASLINAKNKNFRDEENYKHR